MTPPFTNSLGSIWTNRVQFLEQLRQRTMATLQSISEKELAGMPLSPNEVVVPEGHRREPRHSVHGRENLQRMVSGIVLQNARALHSVGLLPATDGIPW